MDEVPHLLDEEFAPSPESEKWATLKDKRGDVFYQSWLELQVEKLEGCYSCILAVFSPQAAQFEPVALWPESPPSFEELSELTSRVISEKCGLITAIGKSKDANLVAYGIAYPIMVDGEVFAVIASATKLDSPDKLSDLMQALQWGASWIELTVLKQGHDSNKSINEKMSVSIDLLSKVLAENNYNAAAMKILSELSVLLGCELVTIGSIKNKKSEITHLSHSADFGKKMNLIRLIEKAMDEAADQRQAIIYPSVTALDEKVVLLSHSELGTFQGGECIMTVPLYLDDNCSSVLCFERKSNKPFTQEDVQYINSISEIALAVLEEKKINDLPLIEKIRDAASEQVKRLVGPGFLGRKGVLVGVIFTLLFFTFAKGEYRLSSDAILEAAVQRVLVAPYDGYIKSAEFRVGDRVQKGDVLLGLDEKDIQLEKAKWVSMKSKQYRQYQEAMASHNRANTNIISAQVEQTNAQIQLIESQIKRAKIVAPFSGLILSGDLSQRIGGAVHQGEVLYKLSPLDRYRIYIKVKESRIADLKINQSGSLYLSALPDEDFDITLSKITPLTTYENNATYYRVEAEIHQKSLADNRILLLQPGMEGVAKVTVDKRRLISIWTRTFFEWVRLSLWRWWG